MALRFGLIGCGGVGQLRAAALAHARSLQLVAVSDIDKERARAVASGHKAAVDQDWQALLHRDEVDAVIVSTPPCFHAEMSIAALEAGKHVLCEKPLARSPHECRQMIAAAERHGRFLATGFNYRFFPSMQKARELLEAGAIGELDHIRSYAGYSAAEHNHPWLHDAQVVGGGALRDNGIHLIDLTRYFLGDVAEVKGFASDGVWSFERCEDNGFALLRSPDGKIATLQASWTEWRGYRFQIELYGARGCIRASCFPMLTQLTWASERGGPTHRKHYYFLKTHIMEHLRSYRWVAIQSFVEEFHAFARALQGARTALATGFDGLQAVAIAAAASQPGRGEPALALAL